MPRIIRRKWILYLCLLLAFATVVLEIGFAWRSTFARGREVPLPAGLDHYGRCLAWSPHSDSLAFRAFGERAQESLVVFHIENQCSEIVATGDFYSDLEWSPDARTILDVLYDQSGLPHVFAIAVRQMFCNSRRVYIAGMPQVGSSWKLRNAEIRLDEWLYVEERRWKAFRQWLFQ